MCSARANAALPALGFPIRESADQRLFSAYPRLIAAVHALHRLLVPRHPPCALIILTVMRPGPGGPGSVIPVLGYCCAVLKVRRGPPPARAPSPRETRIRCPIAGRRSLKTQQHADASVSSRSSRPGRHARGPCCAEPVWRRRTITPKVLPRKEVIQPQLPLRLPCYDFTPVTSPTFDGSLPKGLGHRLRVLLTPVV